MNRDLFSQNVAKQTRCNIIVVFVTYYKPLFRSTFLRPLYPHPYTPDAFPISLLHNLTPILPMHSQFPYYII